jgi:transcriptional regulator with XRE-family HTH domain
MGRKKAEPAPEGASMSPILIYNAKRLGWSEEIIRYSDIAKAISDKVGKPVSRQRVSLIMNSHNVTPEALEMLAKGLGVPVRELTRPIPPASRK